MGYADRAKAGAGDFAPSWSPEKGDTVMGVVTDTSERTKDGRNGPITYPIATIATAEGSEGSETFTGEHLALHGASFVLGDQLKGARVGDFIYSEYEGQKKSKNGNYYYAYNTVVIEPGDKDFPEGLKGDVPQLAVSEDDDADEEPF